MERPDDGGGSGRSSRTATEMEFQYADAQYAMDEALERQLERKQRYEARLSQQAREAQQMVGKDGKSNHQQTAAGKATEVEIEERDQKPVVDWTSQPDAEVARISRLFQRPTYVLYKEEPPIAFWFDVDDGPETGLTIRAGGEVARVERGSKASRRGVSTQCTLVRVGNTLVTPADSEADIRDMLSERPVEVRFNGRATDKRLVFDKASAVLDEKGWASSKTEQGQTPQEYPYSQLDIEEMGTIGGVGLRLYFYVLWFLGTCFFVMAVLSTPSIIIAYSEFNMYEHAQARRYKSFIAETTLGNINTPADDLRLADEPFSHSLWTLSAIEATGSVFLLCMVVRAGSRIRQLVETVDQSAVTMADYTVMVQPMREWKAYRSKHKLRREAFVQDVQAALEQAVSSSRLARINGETCLWIAWDDDENIVQWKQKREKLMTLEAALGDAYRTGNSKRLDKVTTELEDINSKIDALNNEMEWTPVFAFATFNSGEHMEEALRKKQVEIGGVTCEIHPAPEPESLLWQHLEYGAKERTKRKYTMLFFTGVSLFLGAALIAYANALKTGLTYATFCADVMGSEAKYSMCPLPETPEQLYSVAKFYHHMFVQLDGDLQIIPRGETKLRSDVPYQQCSTCLASDTDTDTGECSLADLSADSETASLNCASAGACLFHAGPGPRGTYDTPCHTVDTGTWETTEYLMAGGDLDAMCYSCICTLTAVEETKAQLEDYAAATPGFLPDDQETYCAAMDTAVAEGALWGNIAAVIVVVINQALKLGIKKSAPYAKAHTREEEMVSTSLRVYCVQVLNTAILMLILRSEASLVADLPGEHYPTVNAKWYAEVGAPLVQTMIIQFATPPSVHVVTATVNHIKATIKARSAKTQNQLNLAHAPHNFEIAAGYGEVLLATSVTLIFGAGIPLLYHVAAFGFFIRYHVDKWVVLRVTRKPPLYSKELFESFDEMFSVLLLVHIAMAVYFFASAGGEEPSTSYIYADAVFFDGGLFANFHPHVWPVFAVLCLVLLVVMCKLFKKTKTTEADEENQEILPPFMEAYTKGLIINEDDDYMMDEYEELMDLIEVFQDALTAAREQRQRPLKGKAGKKLYQRLAHAVNPVLGRDWIRGPDSKVEGTAEAADEENTFAAARP